MAFVKRSGLAGSAAGSLILAALLFRGVAPNPAPRSETENKQDRSAAGQSNEPRQSKATKNKWQEEGPWKASRKHFVGLQPENQSENQCASVKGAAETKSVASRGGVTLASQQAGQASEIKNERSSVWCIPDDVQVRAMIAIVPDPVHSHLALVFDRTVEALQLSAESMHYVVDRYWLPWQAAAPENSENEKQPGLLLFRWNGRADASNAKVLYIYLVSDTSTSGIDGAQFRNAVQYVQQVCGTDAGLAAGCGDNNRIWIMGPTFSGSLASLRTLTCALPQANFTAYSGTVSSIDAIGNQGLRDQPAGVEMSYECVDQKRAEAKKKPAINKPQAATPSPVPHLTFVSLVNDSETVVRRFLETLQGNGEIKCNDPTAPEVAILSEAATSYGAAGGGRTGEGGCQYASFRFPREISSLRNASASSGPQAPVSPQTGVSQGPTYLPFTLVDRQPNAGDEPPDFSRVQGPLSKEAVLMKYAAELRSGHYKFVGIVGTNVVDVLFLAGFLRSSCPDVRLFILNSELLFGRDQDNAAYIGTLFLSTYPLISRNLKWTSPRRLLPRLPFGDQYEQGQYNAALLVMQAVVPVTPAPALLEVSPAWAASQFHGQPSLPVWITAVGTGGYWPIAVIPPQAVAGAASTAAGAPATPAGAVAPPAASTKSPAFEYQMESQDFSPSWRTAALLLASLALLLCWILWTVKPVKSLFRDLSLIGAAPAQRFFFINAASASLALGLALFITPAWRFGMGAGGYVAAIAVLGLMAILALIVSCAYLCRVLHLIRGAEARPEANRWYGWSIFFSATAWVVAGLCAWLWEELHYDDLSHYGFFFGYRSVNLASVVSPLTPMLLLLCAISFWSAFEILRLRFDDQIRPRLSTQNYFPGEITEAPIADAVNKYFLSPNYLTTFFVIFAAWLFSLHPERPFELFEKSAFGVLYELLFCLVVALMLTSGLRLAQTWAKLRDLLRELERSPVRQAFDRLHGGSWSPIWQSGGQEVQWTSMVRSIEVIQQIKNCSAPLKDELAGDIRDALAKRDEIREKVRLKPGARPNPGPGGSGNPSNAPRIPGTVFARIRERVRGKLMGASIPRFRELEKLFSELQWLLSKVLNDIMNLLQEHWDEHRPDENENKGSGKEELLSKVLSDVRNLLREPGDPHRPEANEGNKLKKEDEPAAKEGSQKPPAPDRWSRMEEYVALRYVAFIRGVLGHIRLWLILQAAVFSLVLLSLNVYSFEPHRSLIWSFTAIFGFLGVVAIQVLMQAHRNPVISHITGTQPNELGWQFFARVATLGAVPLLTLLATHFPSIGRYLLSFFQPGLEVLK